MYLHKGAKVACSSSQQEPVSKQEMMQALESAVAREDYAAAAQLKKQIEELTHQDPILALQKQLQDAVDDERYQVG
jgi:protein-arginine kinase activator protein McsA